jgi:hypothetical protein
MDPSGATTRLVSIDFTVDASLAVAGSAGRILVPLAVVTKGAVKNLSTKGPAGEALPVLETSRNGELATAALVAMARRVLPVGMAANELTPRIEKIVFGEAPDSEQAATDLASWLEANGCERADPTVDALVAIASTFATHFLFVVELDAARVGTRTVVKYSHEDAVPSFPRRPRLATRLQWSVPQFGMAASWHFQVGALPGVRIADLVVQEVGPGGEAMLEWEDSTEPGFRMNVAHVACRPTHRFTTATAVAVLRPSRSGLVTAAVIGACAVGLAIIAVLLSHCFPGLLVSRGIHLPSSSVSVVLAGPALLLSWLGRSSEHSLVGVALSAVRAVVVASATVLFGMALLAALPLTSGTVRVVWIVLILIQLAALFGTLAVLRSVRSGA